MIRRMVLLGVLATLAAAGCSIDPAVSDTGYVGTWTRGNLRTRSTIAIAKVGEEYRFRWDSRGADGRFRIVCDWDGRCEQWLDGKKDGDWVFRVWKDVASGRLVVESFHTRTPPETFEQREVNELVVTDGGKVLWSYTVERDGEKFEFGKGPRRSHDKVGDGIAYPPRPKPTS